MTKYGWWNVKFDLTLDGEDVRWDDLDECTQEHIAECIKEGYYGGEIVMEDDVETRYYVCGIGYDENDCVVGYDVEFGDFDTYEEAYELFIKIQCGSVEAPFYNEVWPYQILIQLEECEEDGDEIRCVDVKNEWWIINPNYEEEN